MSQQHHAIEQLSIDRSIETKHTVKTKLISLLMITVIITLGVYWFIASALVDDKNSEVKLSLVSDESGLIVKEKLIYDDKNQSLNNNSTLTQLATNQSDISRQANKVLDASGHIIARRVATVSSQITGKLNVLSIEEGQRVTKFQVIAELDDQQAQISYQLALAELAAKHADFDELVVVQHYQEQRLQRDLELLKNKLISEQLVDDSRFKIDRVDAQLNSKKAMITLAKTSVELAQYQLSEHQIRAPFDGVVISKNAQVGELISAGSSGGGFIRTGVGTIVDMSSLEIEVEVAENYINRVFEGQFVTATLDAYPQWHINSEVVAVIPTADREKASIRVRVKLLEVDNRILPDMGVKVSFFERQETDNTLAVINTSVLIGS